LAIPEQLGIATMRDEVMDRGARRLAAAHAHGLRAEHSGSHVVPSLAAIPMPPRITRVALPLVLGLHLALRRLPSVTEGRWSHRHFVFAPC
jgi:hypothetical protein